MIDLADFQFELIPDVDYSADSVGFGLGLNISVDKDGFDPGSAEWATQDGQNPLDGSTVLGRDQLLGPTWAWNAFVNEQEIADALATLSTLARVWRARTATGQPQRVSAIRYQLDGRRRLIFGRPRRFNAPPNNQLLNGYIPVTMDFKCIDALHYDADMKTTGAMNFVVESDGGVVFPLIFPISPLPDSSRDGAILVGGDAPTWPIITFNGPILNPKIQWGSREWSFTYNLLDGDSLTIDTRPWKRTILRNGQYNISGAMNRRQYLSDMVLEPGGHEIAFRGQSSTGTASCTVSWYDAYEGY
jgi:hypothetical protein